MYFNVGKDFIMSEYLEFQRYGRNKSTLVNSKYISSGEYRKKFDKITNNADLSRYTVQVRYMKICIGLIQKKLIL